MAVTAAYRRLFLRVAWRSAQDSALSLSDVLLTAGAARIHESEAGRIVVGASANGQSYSFAVPSAGEPLSPAFLIDLVSGLLDLYESLLAQLTTAGLPHADADVYAAMMADDRLQSVRETYLDSSLLRYGGNRTQ